MPHSMFAQSLFDRRGFLSWVAGGLGGAGAGRPASAGSLAASRRHARRSQRSAAPSPAQGPPRHPHLPVRRLQPRRFVRLQAGAGQIPRQAAGSPRKARTFSSARSACCARTIGSSSSAGKAACGSRSLFPHIAEVADELTVIRSMVAESSNHTPATFQENTGFRINGFPVLGSWLSYGLGSETDDLPALRRAARRARPAGRQHHQLDQRLSAGPASGSRLSQPRARRSTICFRPVPSIRPPTGARASCCWQHEPAALRRARMADDALAARIRSLSSWRPRCSWPCRRSPTSTPRPRPRARCTAWTARETADFGRSCLLARRLLEQGVRFVQLFSGGSFGSPRINWDGHENVIENHTREAGRIDRAHRRPAARSAAARHARRHAGAVHHRVRPHAVHAIGRRRRRSRAAITTSMASPSGWPAPD